MDYAINEREPTINIIKGKLADLQEKINTYKPVHSLDFTNDAILTEINDITTLIYSTYPLKKDNITYKNSKIAPLLSQLNKLKTTYAELAVDLQKPVELEGNYEVSKIQVASNYSHFILFLLCTVFISVSLVYIFKNPEVGNLDMFILGLAVIILIYYIYEYIQKKRRS